MFTFENTPVMFAGLLILFVWCTAWSAVELVASRTTEQRISTGLHLLMSAVMLLMVPRTLWAPFRSVVGYPVLIAVFFLAAAWFVWLAVRVRPAGGQVVTHRVHLVGHALMFGAMAWHLAGMLVLMQGASSGGTGSMQGHGHGHVVAPDGAMSGPSAADIVAWVGLPFMAALLVMTVRALVTAATGAGGGMHRAHAPAPVDTHAHAHASTGGGTDRTHLLATDQTAAATITSDGVRTEPRAASVMARVNASMMAAMCFGMFWMSVGLVTPRVPFLAVLQV